MFVENKRVYELKIIVIYDRIKKRGVCMDDFQFEYDQKKKTRLKKGPIYMMACILCLVIGGVGGYFIHDFQSNRYGTDSDVYNEIAQIIENDFLDTSDNDTSLQERMLNGMVLALGDPYSSYLSLEQSQELGTSINGTFEGIGITYTMVDDGAIVLDVYQNTPAQKAGIQKGDIITHIEGTSIAGYTSDKVKEMIQGESQSQVALRLLRDGKSQNLSATRQNVDTSIASSIMTVNQQKVGYLRIVTFGENIHEVIETKLQDMKSQKINHIIIDLRDNSGGYLNAAQEILDLFVPEGQTLFSLQDKDGKTEEYKATSREKYVFEHGYILVNQQTASASEVLSAGLKENLDYQLIGETTYGKGVAQTQVTLSNSSVLKYTHEKWLTPHGTWINGTGLEPDYVIDETNIHDFHVGEMKQSYQYDDVDNNIQYMQEMLQELGYSLDRQDGYFSHQTTTALEAFEKDYALKQDGIYSQNDRLILLSALTYHLYQEKEDVYLQKVNQLIQ